MTFNEFCIETESDRLEFEEFFERCNILFESCMDEYRLNRREELLNVIEEKGNSDLPGKAEDGLVGKATKTIKALIAKLIEFIKKLVENTKKFFSDKKTEIALKKLEKAAKSDPQIKNKKVRVIDTNAALKFDQEQLAKVSKKRALFKAGKGTEKDLDDLEAIRQDQISKRNKLISVVVVSVGAAIGMLAAYKMKFKKTTETGLTVLSDKDYKEIRTPEQVSRFLEADRLTAEITKETTATAHKSLKDCLNALISIFKKNKDINESTNEGYDNYYSDSSEEKCGEHINGVEDKDYLSNIMCLIDDDDHEHHHHDDDYDHHHHHHHDHEDDFDYDFEDDDYSHEKCGEHINGIEDDDYIKDILCMVGECEPEPKIVEINDDDDDREIRTLESVIAELESIIDYEPEYESAEDYFNKEYEKMLADMN